MVTFLLLLAAVVSASEDEAALTLTAAMSADDACLSATCSLKLIQLKAAAATAPSQDQEALILTAPEEQEDPNKFCSDRHEEGWHCDGKKRVHCEREGREWKANRKHECDRACRRGQCSNMLGQFSEQEAPAGPPTEALILTASEEQEDPNKFCSDRHEEGWHCDGKKRVHCEREGREWKANRKHECDRACRRGQCSNMLGQFSEQEAPAGPPTEALILTAAEEQEDPNKFCSDRHEEGWHCDGKKRVHCEREGREWKANRKHECDRACRRGQCSNMLGQFSEQEAPAGPPTDPNKFCEDKKKDGWSCDGKKRVHCKKKHHKWEVAKKVDCEDKKEECHEGKCKKAKKP
ncbi:unnamed protein product [Polarella glacialis]|uniref:Uncharacterized protein n=1 Tax=Polarella glacialis TaxID=89957 RepID=A0A813K4Y8_POLGL|nr:unnamed protein product [Polarella glacialis]